MSAASTWVPVIAAVVAAVAAIIVPWLTFRHTTRQDYIKWHRDQRAQLYVDLLAEAQAEKQYMQHETARAANPDFPDIYTDLRMPPDKRAQLGARMAMFASRKVLRHFNAMQGIAGRSLLGFRHLEPTEWHARVGMDEAHDALQEAIRAEMRSDERSIVGRR